MLSLLYPSIATRAFERVAERESSHSYDLNVLAYIHELQKMGQRVLTRSLARGALMTEKQAYSRVKRLMAAGWVARQPTRAGQRAYPSLYVTAAGLLVIERIRREMRTCVELLRDSSRGPLKTYRKRKPVTKC